MVGLHRPTCRVWQVFTAGAALIASSTSLSSTLAAQLSALVYGHAALVQIADVLNEQAH